MTNSGVPGAPGDAAGRITPAHVRGVLFAAARRGRRGYDEAEVDDFLDSVEVELERLAAEKTDLQHELEELRQELARDADEELRRSSREEAAAQALGILGAARETADRYVEDARARAEEIVAEAESHAAAVVSRPVEEPAAASTERRGEVEEELARLRQVAEECRAQLDASMRALDDLETGRTAVAEPVTAGQVLPRQVDLRDEAVNGHRVTVPE